MSLISSQGSKVFFTPSLSLLKRINSKITGKQSPKFIISLPITIARKLFSPLTNIDINAIKNILSVLQVQ